MQCQQPVLLGFILLAAALISAPLLADKAGNSSSSTKNKAANPHQKLNTCLECHKTNNSSALNERNLTALCDRCHRDMTDHAIIHPVDMPVPKKMYRAMDADFKAAVDRSKGKLSCVVCHDFSQHDSKSTKTKPLLTIRGAGTKRSNQCYSCHPANEYQRLNPHDQVDAKGSINKKKCLICHVQTPQQLADGRVRKGKLHPEFESDRKELCRNCHRPPIHPGKSIKHLAKPVEAVALHRTKMQKELSIELPLEPSTGRMYCATCHNPHERGVIKNPRLSEGSSNQNRLRYHFVCMVCHSK